MAIVNTPRSVPVAAPPGLAAQTSVRAEAARLRLSDFMTSSACFNIFRVRGPYLNFGTL